MVKNESARLAKCIESLRRVADHISVLDTGSTDDTFELAQGLADTVYRSELFDAATPTWAFNFAHARNELLGKTPHGWCLSVDCDESVIGSGLREWLDVYDKGHVLVPVLLMDAQSRAWQRECWCPRLFVHDGSVRWQGKYHDLPMPWDDRAERIPTDVLRLENDGRPERNDLHERNITLLKGQIAEEGKSGFTLLQIANEYKAMGGAHCIEALGYYHAMLASGSIDSAELAVYVRYSIAVCYRMIGCLAEAMRWATEVILQFPTYVWGYVLLGQIYERMNQPDLAICWYQRATEFDGRFVNHPNVEMIPDRAAILRHIEQLKMKGESAN